MNEPIVVRDLATGQEFTEQVEGENWLRLLYENAVGAPLLHTIVVKPWLSRLYGRKMTSADSRRLIRPFIERHGLDESEFRKSIDCFESFNDFFTRQLTPDARAIDENPETVVLPADGRHLLFPDVSEVEQIFVKGQRFDLARLLDDPSLAARYEKAPLLLSRLCPVDYHRFHFPSAGRAGETRTINGPLYSVSPIALRRTISRLWENKRTVTELATPQFGTLLLLEVGATMVGSIEQSYEPGHEVAKGEEKGIFHLGGSTTITLLDPQVVWQLDERLLQNTADGLESYARMGTAFASKSSATSST
ncbi:MAG: phosphatidylserine decarboxylase [Verrucomicrobiota bacterium JB023]|nr:phosphatidylserine decarboxylase [Verrucomicrobiota bacterium JB023]